MGKGTIVQHQGDGLYQVKLVRSTQRIKSRIAAIDLDIAALLSQLIDTEQQRDAAAAALAAVQAATDAEITRINQQYSTLRQTIEDDQDAVDDRTEDVHRAQADVDYLKLLQSQGVEVNEQQMADAEASLKAAEEALKAATAILQADQQKWTERDQDLSAIEKNIQDAAEAAEAYRVADALHRDLVLEKTALQKEKAWLQSKDTPDPTVEAWCADLTTDLTGEVGTIEIPGERDHPSDVVQIRPGFDGGAEYAAQEQFQNLIQAKRDALDARNQAQQRIDAATLALETGRKRVTQLRAHLEALRARPPATEDVYGYLQDLDGKPIAAPKGITEAEIVAAEGQLHAAEAQIPVLEARKTTMATALTAAQTALLAAHQAVENAQKDEQKPRNADGQLQPIAAAPGPFSSFFNQALLPAWQKWRPMYRLGEITELAGDQATVKLDAAKSSQQGIDINRDPLLHQVPIRYMDCNGGAFQVGDRVIVEFAFHDPERPAVIGFESHPRPCSVHGLYANYNGTVGAYLGKKQAFIKNASFPPTYTLRDDQKAVGGPIAVTGPLERNPDGSIKSGQKFDVFSCRTSQPGWIPVRWPRGGPIYRNGKKLTFDTVTGGFDSAPFSPDQFSGVGVKVVTLNPGTPQEETIRRLVAVAISGQGAWATQTWYEYMFMNDYDLSHQVTEKPGWKGDYLICYSDPPYTELVISQHLRIDDNSYGPYWTTFVPERPVIFFFNASCTIASGIKNRVNRSYADGYGAGVQHLDIGADGTTAAPRWEIHPQNEAGGETIRNYKGDHLMDIETIRTNWARNPPRAVAIGYVGDVEKRLTVESTWDRYSYAYNTQESLVPKPGVVDQLDDVTTYTWRCGQTAISETVANHELLEWPYSNPVNRVTEHIYIYGVDFANDFIWHLKAHGEYSAMNMVGAATPTVVTVGNGNAVVLYSGPEIKEQKPKPTYTSVGISSPQDLVTCSFQFPIAMGHQHDTLFTIDMPAWKYYSPAGDLFATYYTDLHHDTHDINHQAGIPEPVTPCPWGEVGAV